MPQCWTSQTSPVYPGRMIGVGRSADQKSQVVVYMLTGRSSASQARKIVQTAEGHLKTQVTDPEQLKTGIPALLLYECMHITPQMIFVSNGAQTEHLKDVFRQYPTDSPLQLLSRSAEHPQRDDIVGQSGIDLRLYEPDAPHHTPRICGAIHETSSALSIVKSVDDQAYRCYYSFFNQPGQLRCISTYQGENIPGQALPSYEGEPSILRFEGETPQEVAEYVLSLFSPPPGSPDLRVSLAVVLTSQDSSPKIHIWNRHSQTPHHS